MTNQGRDSSQVGLHLLPHGGCRRAEAHLRRRGHGRVLYLPRHRTHQRPLLGELMRRIVRRFVSSLVYPSMLERKQGCRLSIYRSIVFHSWPRLVEFRL